MADARDGAVSLPIRASLGVLPLLAVAACWYAAPRIFEISAYKLPPFADVFDQFTRMIADGTLARNLAASAERFVLGFAVGAGIAFPLGVAIALNRHVSDLLRPTLIFFQSIAGIAWVPLAIIWFGFGRGPVIFVVANTVFFSVIYNIVSGVEAIPPVLKNALSMMGASPRNILFDLVLPGALTQIIVGLRTSFAFGVRALVGAEMIAGTSGIGFMTIYATQSYGTDIVLVGMLLIASIWLALDLAVLKPIEKRTVVRWGMQS